MTSSGRHAGPAEKLPIAQSEPASTRDWQAWMIEWGGISVEVEVEDELWEVFVMLMKEECGSNWYL